MMQPGAGMPPPQQFQQQYQQQPPPPQQWMMQQQQPPPQQQQQPQQGYQMAPPQQQFWPQQPPTPQAAAAAPMQMQQYTAEQMGGSNEVKSLWIGDLQAWMEENYIFSCFSQTGELASVKVIRNRHTGQPEGYGFIEFKSRAAAENVLQTYNGTLMPSSEQPFRLNWASLGAGERRADDGPDYTIFVGDLAADVTDYLLLETFKPHYTSIKGAKVVTDRMTGRTKGYGFVKFGDESEQLRAMSEMNGVLCSSRPMRIGPAATKKPASVQPFQKATYQNSQANPGENDPTNTTIFVGGLEESVSDDHLRQVFGQFGDLVHVKIPAGKRCGFVQFSDRACAEQALSVLNGTQIGGTNVRLSWGRSPNKQAQADQTQWNNGGYYGYAAQGYEAYGYAPPAQDPNAYYGAYPGYGSYQQPQQ